MPFHPDIAVRLPLLEGIPSLEAALSEPSMRAQMEAFDAYPEAPPPPPARSRMVLIPGPHGPVPVRIYTPEEHEDNSGHAFVWLCMEALSNSGTWTRTRQTGQPGNSLIEQTQQSLASITGWPLRE